MKDKNFEQIAQEDNSQALEDMFVEQYDPNNDFRIFGVGDPTKGGLQSLQEKQNLADDVNEAGDSSSDTEQECEDAGASQTPAKGSSMGGELNSQHKLNVEDNV